MRWYFSRSRRHTGDQQFESYYKFGFVRNPWGRVASLYPRKEGLQMRDKMTFDEFVDWKIISKRLSITAELPHKNRNSDKMHYSEYYNEKTKEIIRKKFTIDIEHFEYEFDS